MFTTTVIDVLAATPGSDGTQVNTNVYEAPAVNEFAAIAKYIVIDLVTVIATPGLAASDIVNGDKLTLDNSTSLDAALNDQLALADKAAGRLTDPTNCNT